MSGIYYTNPYANPYAAGNLQYGVNMPSGGSSGSSASSLASLVPYVGPLVSAGMNLFGTWYQNHKQEEYYENYMSPLARMAQMTAAGINPNAAAQGISGASAPQMTAATPTGAFTGVGEQLGNSVNTALTADVLRSEAKKNFSEATLTDSLNVKQGIENTFVEREHVAALDKLVAEGEISRSFANMAKVDEFYKGASAEANYRQLLLNLDRTVSEIGNLNARTEQAYAEAYSAMKHGNLAEAQIHKVFSDIGVNEAMIRKMQYEQDVLVAQEEAIYQDINESKARQMAQEILNKFQADYYEIWQNTGFNWNSDIEKSVVGAYQNLQLGDGDRMMRGLQAYINGVGEARAGSPDYQTDKYTEILGDVIRLGGIFGGASIAGSKIGYTESKTVNTGRYSRTTTTTHH